MTQPINLVSNWSMRKSHHHSFLSFRSNWLNNQSPKTTPRTTGLGECLLFCFVDEEVKFIKGHVEGNIQDLK